MGQGIAEEYTPRLVVIAPFNISKGTIFLSVHVQFTNVAARRLQWQKYSGNVKIMRLYFDDFVQFLTQ